jgi:hypothetical protein
MGSKKIFGWRYLNTPQSMLADELWRWTRKHPGQHLRILDCGSGSGNMWSNGELGNFVEANSNYVSISLLDAVTPDSKLQPEIFTQIVGVLPQAMSSIPDNAFDVVTAFDVIEHLDRSNGYLLLYEMDRVGRDFQAIYTPTGFLWQPPSRNNPHNAHVSGWHPKELKFLGWKSQTGLMGFKWLMAPYGAQKFSGTSKIATALIGNGMKLSQVLARPFPSLAHSFFATKYIKNPRVLDQEL